MPNIMAETGADKAFNTAPLISPGLKFNSPMPMLRRTAVQFFQTFQQQLDG